jgi:cell wall assembly regulator SMI1
MMTVFSQTEVPVTIAQIEEVEKYIGLEFPKPYKNHLLKYNGGQCTPNVFIFEEGGAETSSIVDWFLAIYDGDSDSLKEAVETYKVEEKRMPLHMLPIAHDPGGNLICISCGAKDNGFIYFWNHEDEVDYEQAGDDDYSNLYLIAKDFDTFLENLMTEDN